MMSFGSQVRVEVFGSSHGPEVGAVVTGLPAGLPLDMVRVQQELDRRRPVGRRLATKRQEEDVLVLDSGVRDGRTDGTPVRGHVRNVDIDRSPYERLRDTPRPGHADYPARVRYGPKADLSGGGIFSGRMTVGLVFAGAIARQMLERKGVELTSFTESIAGIRAFVPAEFSTSEIRKRSAENEVGCPDPTIARRMEDTIGEVRRTGDSLGGTIETRVTGLPTGLGEPFFDSLEGTLAHALFAVPAVKGIEFGAGFAAAAMRGSEHNDPFAWEGDHVVTVTNHSGGILGGLATGMPLVFRVVVKPTSSIARPQQTVNLRTHESTTVVVTGRHDPCIVPRAVVVIESVTAFALLDLMVRGGFFP
ncbi:MAG: chorismate synthase [Thermoplasmata archaeon]